MISNAPNRYFFLTGVATIALMTGSCSSSIFEANRSKTSDITETLRSPEALITMGDTTWRGGDVAEAARFYQAAVKAAPKDPLPAFRLGRALQVMGAFEAAADQFRKVLELKPGDGEAKRQLANTLISLDDPEGSIKLYREVIAKSGDPRAFNGLGVAFDMTGKHKEALAAYRAGLAKQPDSLSLKNNLALSMAIAGQYENAAKVLRNVASDPRATARHRQNLALVYGLAGHDSEAARVARVDLDAPSVKRNLDYYNWLRQQPRWMVGKLLRSGAPVKPQAAKVEQKGKAAPLIGTDAPHKAKPTARRKPVHATPREAVRPAPKRQNVAAQRRVDENGVIRQASLAGNGEPPIRFARLEFGFRPVRDAEPPKAAARTHEAARKPEAARHETARRETAKHETVVARLESRQPVVVQPRLEAPMPVVVRGAGETPEAATAKPAAAAKTAAHKAEAAQTMPRMKVIHTQLALAGSVGSAERTAEAAARREIEAQFQHSGLEYLMGKDDPATE
jgi:Flp pilus assembly protein TadD